MTHAPQNIKRKEKTMGYSLTTVKTKKKTQVFPDKKSAACEMKSQLKKQIKKMTDDKTEIEFYMAHLENGGEISNMMLKENKAYIYTNCAKTSRHWLITNKNENGAELTTEKRKEKKYDFQDKETAVSKIKSQLEKQMKKDNVSTKDINDYMSQLNTDHRKVTYTNKKDTCIKWWILKI